PRSPTQRILGIEVPSAGEDSTDYAFGVRCERDCTLYGHHDKSKQRLRGGAVNARRPRGTRGRSGAESIDGAEHSARLHRVMAAVYMRRRTGIKIVRLVRRRMVNLDAWQLRYLNPVHDILKIVF